jgi:thiosulfate/3-mercaptopyruvate sulfurtransferase
MRNSKVFVSILCLLLFVVASLSAQTDIITAKEFMQLTKTSDDLVILDVNKSKNYAASHIKNAIHVNHMDLYNDSDISGLIETPENLAAFFGNLGITENTTVVLTDDGSQKYNSRVYWILKYLGAEDVKLLHKDMTDWRAARVPLTSTPFNAKKAVTFTPTVNPDIIVDMAYVKENKDLENVVLVDCRTADEYAGVTNSEGHIPGAININYEDFLTETGAFKSVEALNALVAENGITADTEVILYCKTSVRATPAFIALTNILGFENVKVYDGAYNEWVANMPVIQ